MEHIEHTGCIDQPYQFVGQMGYHTHWQDAHLTLLQLGVRFYDPEIGRFGQRDSAGAPYEMAYAYARNSPLTALDPTGKYCVHVLSLPSGLPKRELLSVRVDRKPFRATWNAAPLNSPELGSKVSVLPLFTYIQCEVTLFYRATERWRKTQKWIGLYYCTNSCHVWFETRHEFTKEEYQKRRLITKVISWTVSVPLWEIPGGPPDPVAGALWYTAICKKGAPLNIRSKL